MIVPWLLLGRGAALAGTTPPAPATRPAAGQPTTTGSTTTKTIATEPTSTQSAAIKSTATHSTAVPANARQTSAQNGQPAEAPPAKTAPKFTLKERIARLYSDFRSLKDKLPFQLGAGIYLYLYQPVDPNAAESYNRLTTYFELFAAYFTVDKEYEGFGGHIEFRVRDKNALRVSSIDNLWLQLAYAYWKPSPGFSIKVGKIYQSLGLGWDDSFYGDLLYYDGLKLNPDWGLSAEGDLSFDDGVVDVSYAGQYFLRSDDVTGAYSDRRTYYDPNATDFTTAEGLTYLRTRFPGPEGERDSAGNPMTLIEKTALARVSLGVTPRDGYGFTLSGSGETGLISRHSDVDHVDDPDVRYYRAGADLTLSLGPFGALGEYLHQGGDGTREADYVLAGVKANWKTLTFRLTGSWVRYHLSPDIDEYLILPGITWTVGGGLILYAEYAEWQRRDPRISPGYFPYDRSFNFSIEYDY